MPSFSNAPVGPSIDGCLRSMNVKVFDVGDAILISALFIFILYKLL